MHTDIAARGRGSRVLTFYATIDADSVRPYIPPVPVLLPASSFARRGLHRTPKLPAHVTERAADCGGFVATRIWGDYRYTPEQYVQWLRSFSPSWAATMDYCCEQEIAHDEDAICRRQERTTEMAYLFWSNYRAQHWCWVPTVQGWSEDDYRAHARQLKPLVCEMAAHYGSDSAFRVGIGTLCQRADNRMIRTIARAVTEELPGVPLHLWGIKIAALAGRESLPDAVVSTDSAAFNSFFGRSIERWRESGLTRREYQYQVALPEYQARIDAALSGPKQRVLF